MNSRKILSTILVCVVLVGTATSTVFASSGVPPERAGKEGKPLGYLIAPDGRKTPVYLIPENVSLTEKMLRDGIVTETQAAQARAFESSAIVQGVGVCPFWTGSPATIISQGWDSDNDWYEDYEHPVGWTNDVVCVTTWYYITKGFPAEEFHNDYKPGIARHRLKVGLSGFPAWFAAAQTTMRWQ